MLQRNRRKAVKKKSLFPHVLLVVFIKMLHWGFVVLKVWSCPPRWEPLRAVWPSFFVFLPPNVSCSFQTHACASRCEYEPGWIQLKVIVTVKMERPTLNVILFLSSSFHCKLVLFLFFFPPTKFHSSRCDERTRWGSDAHTCSCSPFLGVFAVLVSARAVVTDCRLFEMEAIFHWPTSGPGSWSLCCSHYAARPLLSCANTHTHTYMHGYTH